MAAADLMLAAIASIASPGAVAGRVRHVRCPWVHDGTRHAPHDGRVDDGVNAHAHLVQQRCTRDRVISVRGR
jgi:hypothetical protein